MGTVTLTSLVPIAQTALLSAPEAIRLGSLRRSTILFSQEQAGDSVYLIEEGLVKITRTNEVGSRIILTIRGPGDLVGEEALASDVQSYYGEAEVLTPATIYRIPREVAARSAREDREWSGALVTYLVGRRRALAEKVELLCLHDVEYRILHYLAELSTLVKFSDSESGYQLPITQLELADLVGATRETTSTTLNQLERRNLVKLSRRMLTIPSPDALRAAAAEKTSGAKAPVARQAVEV